MTPVIRFGKMERVTLKGVGEKHTCFETIYFNNKHYATPTTSPEPDPSH
jgi:hypothetical protein